MAISTTTRLAGPFIGDDATTELPFGFKVLAATDIQVVVTDASGDDAALTSGYAVSLNDDQDSAPGGTVSLATPLASGTTCVVVSALPITQPVVLTNLGGFFPDVLNDALDRLTIIAQQLAGSIGNVLRAPLSDGVADMTLPSQSARAGRFSAFDANGLPIASSGPADVPISAAMQPAVTAASLAAAREALGLGYAATQDGYAQGYVNRFRNPRMDVAQRGASGSASGAYTLDGWEINSIGGSVAWAQVAGLTLPSGGKTAKALRITGDTGVTSVSLSQKIESHNAALLAGQRVTVQFTIKNDTGATATPALLTQYPGGEDNWSSSTVDVSANLQPITNGGTVTVAYTFDCHANANLGYTVFLVFNGVLGSAAKSVTVTAADIRVTPTTAVGSNAAPPASESRPIGAELCLCQRYYYRIAGDNSSSPVATGWVATTTDGYVTLPLGQTMRVPPTLESSAASLFTFNTAASANACSAMSLNSSGRNVCIIQCVGSGLVAGQGGSLRCASTSAYIGFSAEL